MPSKEAKAAIDARVLARLKAHGLTDVATIGGEEIDGYFIERFETQGAGDDAVLGPLCAFDCRHGDLPTTELEENEEIVIEGYGTYRHLYTDGSYDGCRSVLVLGTTHS